MVKLANKTLLIIFTIYLGIFASCSNDLLGIFRSNDLDERLEEKNNFRYLTDKELKPDFGDEYSFVIVSDIHIEDGDAFGLEKLKKVVDDSHGKIKFLVATGDITQNGAEEDIQKFFEIAVTLGIPCYPVIGNHDIYFKNWSNWKNLIGSTRYRVDSRDTTMFFLDSANAFLGKEQLDWLESEIKTAGKNTFVFTHSNLFVDSLVMLQQFTDVRERARVMSILKDRCDIMFMGHMHKRVIREAGGVEYVMIEDFQTKGVYCLVTVKGENISYSFGEV